MNMRAATFFSIYTTEVRVRPVDCGSFAPEHRPQLTSTSLTVQPPVGFATTVTLNRLLPRR